MDELIGIDWRFLEGIPSKGKALVYHPNHRHPAEGLCAIFDLVITMSESPGSTILCPNSVTGSILASPQGSPFPTQCFDLVALPDGFPYALEYVNLDKAINYLRDFRRLLRPGGSLYLGFANKWSPRRPLRRSNQTPNRYTLRNIVHSIRQAGFEIYTVYAMIPNHKTPVYISPLEKELLAFALKNYLRRNSRRPFLYYLAQPGIIRWLQSIMPAYGIVAQ
jgi:hypothetical protein